MGSHGRCSAHDGTEFPSVLAGGPYRTTFKEAENMECEVVLVGTTDVGST